MNISPDYLIERRRNKKSLSRWKLLAILLALILAFALLRKSPVNNNYFDISASLPQVDYIGRVVIEEVIFEDYKRERKLEQIADDSKIKALIVHVNSPGGSVVGSEQLYNAFRKIAAKKPLVVVMGSLATSGGYLAAIGADYIVAHNGTITGSIGVILQSAEITELAEKLGVKFNNFKSGPLKATPNLTEPVTPEVTEAIMSSINDVYDYFVEIVAKRRNFNIDYARKIADGRVYSGRQALELKLIDSLGDESTAIKWLYDIKGLSKDLKVNDIKLRTKPRYIDMLFDDLENIFPKILMNKSQGFSAIFTK